MRTRLVAGVAEGFYSGSSGRLEALVVSES